MKFMISWKIAPGHHKPAGEGFLKSGAPMPDGLTLIGRWHARLGLSVNGPWSKVKTRKHFMGIWLNGQTCWTWKQIRFSRTAKRPKRYPGFTASDAAISGLTSTWRQCLIRCTVQPREFRPQHPL